MAYIGDEGFLVNTELREGKQHSQKGRLIFFGILSALPTR